MVTTEAVLYRLLSTFLALTLMSVFTTTLERGVRADFALAEAADANGFESDSEPSESSTPSDEEEDERPVEDDTEDSSRDDRDEETRSELERAIALCTSFDVPDHAPRGAPALTTKARAASNRSALPNGFPREEERPPDA